MVRSDQCRVRYDQWVLALVCESTALPLQASSPRSGWQAPSYPWARTSVALLLGLPAQRNGDTPAGEVVAANGNRTNDLSFTILTRN